MQAIRHSALGTARSNNSRQITQVRTSYSRARAGGRSGVEMLFQGSIASSRTGVAAPPRSLAVIRTAACIPGASERKTSVPGQATLLRNETSLELSSRTTGRAGLGRAGLYAVQVELGRIADQERDAALGD